MMERHDGSVLSLLVWASRWFSNLPGFSSRPDNGSDNGRSVDWVP
jgi:hypothetical protein